MQASAKLCKTCTSGTETTVIHLIRICSENVLYHGEPHDDHVGSVYGLDHGASALVVLFNGEGHDGTEYINDPQGKQSNTHHFIVRAFDIFAVDVGKGEAREADVEDYPVEYLYLRFSYETFFSYQHAHQYDEEHRQDGLK